MADKTILVVGTYDTTNDELKYMAEPITAMGGGVLTIDISVLGDPVGQVDVSKSAVAAASGTPIQAMIDTGDENSAMQVMAGAGSALACTLRDQGLFDDVVILGGSMGADAVLDIWQALPLGVPIYVIPTVSFSPVIPTDRLSALCDVMRNVIADPTGPKEVDAHINDSAFADAALAMFNSWGTDGTIGAHR